MIHTLNFDLQFCLDCRLLLKVTIDYLRVKKKQECYLMKIFLRGFPFLLIENEEEQIQIIANRPKQIKPNKISLEIRELYLID